MATDVDELARKLKAAEVSITSLSIYVVLSAAIIGFLASQTPLKFGYNATVVSSGCLLVAIVVFLVAVDFFILCIYHCQHIDWFGLVGSCLYGLGAMVMVVGIAVSLVAFEM